MKPCGKYSLSEGVRAIAIGDLVMIFSIFSIILHIVEGSHATLSDEMKDLHPKARRYLVITASSLLSWIYFGLSCVNAFLALVLLMGATRKSSAKLAAYIMIWILTLILGFSAYAFQVSTLGQSPFYFGLVAYPFFYIYKIYSLWVVKCLRDEIELESTIKIPLLIKRNVKSSRKRKRDTGKQPRKELDIRKTTLAHLKANDFQIDGDKLHIDFGDLIEYDENTAVMKGELIIDGGAMLDVAVKTSKSNANYQTNHNMLLEMKLFTLLDPHENIIQFLGACCDHSSHAGKTFLITEYYPPLKLDRFLIESQDEHYGSFENQIKDDSIIVTAYNRKKEVRSKLVNVNELVRWKSIMHVSETIMRGVCKCRKPLYENAPMKLRENFNTTVLVDLSHQIADGMEYLHLKKIVHGSLSAKNIVLYDSGICKISGFRFAAQLHNNKYNRSNVVDITGSYPWRWMSVECIDSTEVNNFTEKSDAWSYGITLWEIFSMGECPYADWDSDFVEELMKGTRLGKPKFSTTEIYKIMAACWHPEPGERPTFYLLKLFFHQLITSLQSQRLHLPSF